MTNIKKSKFKISRQCRTSIWGDDKDPIHKKNYGPGQHGKNTKKMSEYALHYLAKKTLRGHYGRMTEKQFKNTFHKAHKMKGNAGENFIGLLESRIDTVIYRLNFASSMFHARQVVSHKHIKVNGKSVNIPSYILTPGDVVELTDKAKNAEVIQASIASKTRSIPEYLSFDEHDMKGIFIRKPVVSDVPYPFEPEINRIIELYAR
ncbi:MAG: 30S ribosomal protein S4 [Rickettsiaceae bacterium]